MKVSYIAPLFLASLASAGNVCLSNRADIGAGSENFQVFAAGSPCGDKSRTIKLDRSLCDTLPVEVDICGQKANLVEAEGGVVDGAGGCAIKLAINGKNHPGRRVHMIGETGNGDPCGATCQKDQTDTGLPAQLYGKVIFEGVPMC